MADGQDKDKRFRIKLHLEIEEMKDGVPEGFFENLLTYHDIGYDGVIMVEQALSQTLAELGDQGVLKAMEMGLGEKLEAMGLGPRMAALAKK